MQIKFYLLIIGLMMSIQINAEPPVEVITSCVDHKAIRPTVTVTKLDAPRYIDPTEAGCDPRFENSIPNLLYGSIECNNKGYIIINNQRILLGDANNFSVNPAIYPGLEGNRIDLGADWLKIDFNNNSYLCVEQSLSDSGKGAAANQYYIVENPYGNNATLNYYFFEKDIFPIINYFD